MTIAFLIDSFPALSETFIHNQIIWMMNKGHNVYIFPIALREGKAWEIYSAYNLDGKINLQKNSSLKGYYKTLKNLVGSFIKYKNVRKATLLSLNIFRFGWDAVNLNQFRFIYPFNGKDIDIFYCQFGPNGNLAAELKQSGFDVPIVTQFHGYDIRLGLSKGGKIYAQQFKLASKILSISEYNKKHLIEFGCPPEKIIDHNVGIDTSRFYKEAKEWQPGKIIILSVGRLLKAKGYAVAIEAIKEIVGKVGIVFEYHIIGEGPDEDYFKQLVSNLGLSKHIKFLGGISNHLLHNYYHRSHVFLHPSFAEALPVVIMEAQAAGLPVVATKVGSVHQFVQNNISGILIEPKQVLPTADALRHLLQNEAIAIIMGKRGQQNILDNYNNEIQNGKLEKLFNTLLLHV